MQRTIYFDYLRVIACFSVIVLHVSAQQLFGYEVPTFDWHVMNVYDSATRFCVPIFLMISGALFLDPAKNLSLHKLYTRNILRILTALMFWSLIYACYSHSQNGATSILTYFLCGHFHMWFLWLIIGLYMLVPILRLIARNIWVMRYFLILSILFGFVIPFILDLVKIFFPILTSIAVIIEMCYKNMHLQMLSCYTSYFVLGYYLNMVFRGRKVENTLIALGFLAVILVALFTYISFCISGVTREIFYKNDSLLILLESVSVFLLFKKTARVELKIIKTLSDNSFGIYLVHMFVYYVLGFTATTINPIIGIPLISLLIFVVSYLIILLLSWVPILSKWVI